MDRRHFARRTLATLLCALLLLTALPTVAYAEGDAPESTVAPESALATEEATNADGEGAAPEEGNLPPVTATETDAENTDGAVTGVDTSIADGTTGAEAPAEAALASEQTALTVGSSGNVNGGDHPATTAGLQAAVDAIDDGGTITVMTGVGLDAAITIPAGKGLTITCGNNLGPEYARITSMYGNDPNYAGDMFVVSPGADLTLKELTVHGNNQVQGQARVLVRVNNGSFTLDDTKLMYANNTPNTHPDNCMILADGASAVVTLKKALVDLGVYHGIILDNGAQLMVYEGSEITRHKYTGVVARGGSTITLDGGSIFQNGETLTHYMNKEPLWGGGVLLDNSTLVLQGGTIKDNQATYGGGVYAKNDATILMYSGSIANNGKKLPSNALQGTQQGGGVLLDGAILDMQGGQITGNAATSGSAVYCAGESHIVLAAGQIGTEDSDNGVYLDASLPVHIPAEGMQPGTRVNIAGFRGIDPVGTVGMTENSRDATDEEAAAFRWGSQGASRGGVARENYVLIPVVTGVQLSQSSITLMAGKSTTIGAVVYWNDGTTTDASSLTWTSSNQSVATVENGIITAGNVARKSNATITATAEDGTSATIEVTVLKKSTKPVKVSKVTIRGAKKTLEVGKTLQLKAKVSPSHATNALVAWKSSRPAVLSVDANGKLTALKEGTAKITVKAGSEKRSVTIKVTAPVTSIKVDQTKVVLAKKGKTATITPTVTCSVEGYTAKLAWKSSDKQVATVKNGKITAKGKGTATITVSASNGKSAKVRVTVKK